MQAYKVQIEDIHGNVYTDTIYAHNVAGAIDLARHNPLTAAVLRVTRTSENAKL